MAKTTAADQVRLFGMRNLMLESDLINLEKNGIAIDHANTIKKDELVDTDLFEADILKSAQNMAKFYILYYSLENTIRRLISGRLYEKYGAEWWELKVPGGVKTGVSDKQKKEKDTPMSIRSDDPLTYTNFGELIDILNANWSDFSDTLRSQKATQQILSQFNLVRNIIAHSVELNDDEILRLELLVKDWFRIST